MNRIIIIVGIFLLLYMFYKVYLLLMNIVVVFLGILLLYIIYEIYNRYIKIDNQKKVLSINEDL